MAEQDSMTAETSTKHGDSESDNGDHDQAASPLEDGDGVANVEPPSTQEALEKELQDAKDKHLRLAAEFENFKKRTIRERSDSMKFSNERILKDFLSIVDNLDRALQHAKEGSEGETLVQGVELVHKQCTDLLTRFNVTPVDTIGVQFDPVVHQAVSQVDTDEHPENTVAAEFQKGYRLYDRLLRPALVTVAKAKNAAP